MITDQRFRALPHVRNYLVNAGPMVDIHYLNKGLSTSISGEMNAPIFTSKDNSGTNVYIDRRLLNIVDFGNAVKSLVAECESEITTNLLWNDPVDLPTLFIHDNPRCEEIGYCYVDNNENKFKSFKLHVIQRMLTHRYVEGKYHYVQGDKIIWNPVTCFEWLRRAEAVLIKLLCASLMSSGEYLLFYCTCYDTDILPGEMGRGTELVMQLLRNAPGSSYRNVFFINGVFTFIGTYNKTSALTGREFRMARVPHPIVARQLIRFDILIRPVAVILLEALKGKESARRATQNVFWKVARPLEPKDLSEALATHTSLHLGVELPLRKMRQVINYFTSANADLFPSVDVRTNAAHVQAGHTAMTSSKHYAGDATIPSGVHMDILKGTMLASGVWHELIGLSTEIKDSFAFGRRPCDTVVQMANIPSVNISELARLLNPAIKSLGIDITGSVQEFIFNSVAEARAVKLSEQLPRGIGGSYNAIPLSRLAALRDFLGDPNATWKSSEQAQATDAMIRREEHLIYQSNTGLSLN
jgi:hypothetical protein